MADGDMFLKIDGIKGESKDDKHKDEIHIESYSWGVSHTGTGGTAGGSGGGRAQVHDMSLSKTLDQSSPNLFIDCCSGKHHPKAWLYVRKAGEKPQDYLTIEMDEVFVSSYQESGHNGGGIPQESISLNFSKFKVEYKEQKPDGTLGAANTKTYDIKANKIS